MALPFGFPRSLSSPMAWLPDQVQNEDFIHCLSAEEVVEIKQALKSFKANGLDGDCVNCENFPLPSMRKKLRLLTSQLHDQCGFFILRGLNPKEYTAGDNLVTFLGIADYVGQRRGRQDLSGTMLTHILDPITSSCPRELRRGIHSNRNLGFHNEVFCDILALQVRQTSKIGGELLLSPTWTIYNYLAKNQPEIVSLLSEPLWPAQIPGQPPTVLRPLLFFHDGKIILNVDRSPLQGFAGDPKLGTRPLSTSQIKALDVLDMVAKRFSLEISLKPGDLVFVNNLSITHSRRAFEDDPKHRRHLLRLYLRNDELGWSIPRDLSNAWGFVFQKNHDFNVLKFPVEPKPEFKRPKVSDGSGSALLVPDESDEEE